MQTTTASSVTEVMPENVLSWNIPVLFFQYISDDKVVPNPEIHDTGRLDYCLVHWDDSFLHLDCTMNTGANH